MHEIWYTEEGCQSVVGVYFWSIGMLLYNNAVPGGAKKILFCDDLRATLDEGPRSRDQLIQAILLVKSFKLVPRPLDEGPRPKSGKLRLNLHGTCFGGENQLVGTKK